MTIAEESIRRNKAQGDYFILVGFSGRNWAVALRSGSNAAEPIFVSVGHMISLNTAVEIVKRCTKQGCRIPEPVNVADLGSRLYLKKKGYNRK